MSAEGDRRLGVLFGLLGTALIVVDGLVDIIGGAVFLALGRGLRAAGAFDQGLLYLVFGLLVGFFVVLGRSRGEDRSLAAGLVLVVLVIVGWLVLGTASGLLAVLGSVLVLIAGILYLVAGR